MTAIIITAALMADLVTANPGSEFNPLMKPLMDNDPLLAVAVKVAEIALVLCTVAVCRRWRPGPLAGVVACVAVLAGVGGAWSNLP